MTIILISDDGCCGKFWWKLSDTDSLICLGYVILLSRAVVPLIQGYEDAGDFTMTERLKTSVHVNLVFYLIVGSIGLIGLILLITMRRNLSVATSVYFSLLFCAFLSLLNSCESVMTLLDTPLCLNQGRWCPWFRDGMLQYVRTCYRSLFTWFWLK